jgi:hypothetical protein
MLMLLRLPLYANATLIQLIQEGVTESERGVFNGVQEGIQVLAVTTFDCFTLIIIVITVMVLHEVDAT